MCAPGDAWALVFTTAPECEQQPDNVLRWDCTINTDLPANAWVNFCEGTGCSRVRATPAAQGGTEHIVTIFNMKQSTGYDWQAVARPAAGGPNIFGGVHHITTGALTDAELTDITVSVSGTAVDVKNVLVNYGCSTSGNYSWFIVFDTAGNIVWYEDPANLTTFDTDISGFSISRPDRHVMAIYRHDWVAEYKASGEVTRVLCRNDGSGACPDSTVAADAYFDDYVHHDVVKANGAVWVINAKSVEVDDVLDCDSSSSTHPIVVDGRSPAERCESNYWGADGVLEGCDYSHMNSVWPDGLDNLSMSLLKQGMVFHTRYSDGYLFPDWWFVGDNSSGLTVGSSSVGDLSLGYQHSAYVAADGNFMLFDNASGQRDHDPDDGDTGLAEGPSRGVEMQVDTASASVDILEEYPLSGYCGMGGVAFQTLFNGNVLVGCEMEGSAPAEIGEFQPGVSAPLWSMTLGCDTMAALPMYRALPNLF